MTENTRIKRLFRNAIRRGTGRAYLLMQAHPEVNFGPDILKAACTNFAYDPQCEGSRGEYIVRLMLLSAQKEYLISRVLALLVAHEQEWALTQLFDIARRLALAGYPAARTAFYQRFELGGSAGYAYAGEYELVLLDGPAGLLRAAIVRGRLLAADPENWEDDGLISFTQERNPDVAVETELEKAAATNEHVARYLQAVQESQRPEPYSPSRPAIPDLQYLRHLLANRKRRRIPRHVVRRVVRRLPARQLRLLAAEFEQETSRTRQLRYLQVFRYVKLPLGYKLLLPLAEAQPPHYTPALDDAVEALVFFQSPAIREFALARLSSSPIPWLYASLFFNNYQAGDDRLLLRLVEQTTGEDAIESLAISLCAIYQKNRIKKCQKPLWAIYQRMNCGMHRAQVVELLLKRGVLPADIREEIPFDSYEGVRHLAAGC